MGDKEKIQELEEKLKNSITIEDALTTKVYQKSIEMVKKWAGGYFILVTIILAAFGYTTLRDIDKTIKEFSKSKIEVQLKNELDSLKGRIITSMQQNSINYTNEFDKDLAKIFYDTKNNFETKLQNFADQASKELNKPSLAKIITKSSNTNEKKKGFAYYGIYDGKEWKEVNFINISNPNYNLPQVNDIVEAKLPVNARIGEIQYIEGRGWQNQKLVGTISPGEKVKVLQVRKVAGGAFIWIEFEK